MSLLTVSGAPEECSCWGLNRSYQNIPCCLILVTSLSKKLIFLTLLLIFCTEDSQQNMSSCFIFYYSSVSVKSLMLNTSVSVDGWWTVRTTGITLKISPGLYCSVQALTQCIEMLTIRRSKTNIENHFMSVHTLKCSNCHSPVIVWGKKDLQKAGCQK